MSGAPGIRLERVTLTHGTHAVLGELSLSLSGGRWHAVLGRSGVGKSSLLRLIAALQPPDAGTLGTDDGEPLGQHVAYMAQDDGLLPWLSVLENVRLGPRLRAGRDEGSRERALALLQRVGLGGWEAMRPGALSGGMRQRVALARTLLEARPVVLMDEPFSRLDALTRAELQRLAFELLGERTVVLVTHDPLEALQLAATVTVLHDGLPSRTSTFHPDGDPPRAPDGVRATTSVGELERALAESFAPASALT